MKFLKPSARYLPSFNAIIPSNVNQRLQSEGFYAWLKAMFRLYRRFFTLFILRQLSYEQQLIPITSKKILWFNLSSTSIGDSIMELSGRKLLQNYGFQIDLLTDKKNVGLYKNDAIFQNVFTELMPEMATYDLILLDVYNTKSLNLKNKFFKTTPFCALLGYFYGFDFNRMLFSYQRINALLGYPYKPLQLNQEARNYLSQISDLIVKDNAIAIAIGGEDIIRTYPYWPEIIYRLSQLYPQMQIKLLGSANGQALAQQISDLNLPNVINYVAKLSLLESAAQIASCKYFIGADGGLMHIAEAYSCNGVALFAKFQAEFRLSAQTKLQVLFTSGMVQDISQEIILDLFQQVFKSNLK